MNRNEEITPGMTRTLERLGKPLEELNLAEVLDYAAWAAHMENTMPGNTGVFAKASADAMELYDLLKGC
jgi:hypothetical protein